MDYLKMKNIMISKGLLAHGISDQRVVDAFKKVDRHLFVRKEDYAFAYDDYPLEIGLGQTISQPYIVALMLEKAALKQSDKVLEIGTGSGYQTALLKELVDEVITIERIEALYKLAKTRLIDLGYEGITYLLGDGTKGELTHAPYQAIIVSAAAKTIPLSLLEQLDEGGRLIIPVGNPFYQDLIKITKKGDTTIKENLGGCRFVRLIPSEDSE